MPRDAELSTRCRIETVAAGLQVPWDLAFLPDGTALFTERTGQVRMIRAGRVLPDAVLRLPVFTGNKAGLLGLALDPDFARSKHVFLAWNRAGKPAPELLVQRYRFDGGKLVEPFTLIEGIPAWTNHTGCRLVFGPRDGLLYISTGDANQPALAQRLDSTAGKILRIAKDGSIPAGNPFRNRRDAHPAVFSYGHRNVQGMVFHPQSGVLIASEHGPRHGDEINIVRAGANFGWPLVSHRRVAPGTLEPALEISPAVGPSALLYYRGRMFPELHGRLLMATLRGSSVWRFTLGADGKPVHADRLFHKRWGRIRFLVEAPDESIWLSTSMHDPPEGAPGKEDDRILRLVADPSAPMPHPLRADPQSEEQGPTDLRHAAAPEIYATLCAACHGETLQGSSAPGFRDGVWRFGNDEAALTRNILDGVAGTEMTAWRSLVSPTQAAELARWILSQESAGGKKPR
jgi:glucose/arabinose dehydrogenase